MQVRKSSISFITALALTEVHSLQATCAEPSCTLLNAHALVKRGSDSVLKCPYPAALE